MGNRLRWMGALAMAAGHCLLGAAAARAQTGYDASRKQMVQEVIIGSGISDPRVIQAMQDTPRHEFVARAYRSQAYYDMALPIGEAQTISSPYIVAFMTQALQPKAEDRVLEIGTGSGYQAAVLSPLVKEVYTIEIVPELGQQAERTLSRLRYRNVFVKVGDGYQGWSEHAPFDKIIVTCSPERVPQPLIDQLVEGGLLVVPVGERYQQTLYLMRKTDGKLVAEALQPTLFVPMTGRAEENRQVKPDPDQPRLINGDFEAPVESEPFVPGWYYQRLTTLETGEAPQGNQYVRFANDHLGRPAHLMQGLPLNGRTISDIQITAWVKLNNVRDAGLITECASIAISFYDENRRDLGVQSVGRLQGTRNWYRLEHVFRVPPETREALVRIGLFGAAGAVSFDHVQLIPVRRDE